MSIIFFVRVKYLFQTFHRRKGLLRNYEADNLENNFGKKQKEKEIKNLVEPGYQPPAWSESSESGSDGEISDPLTYDPSSLAQPDITQTYAQHTNPNAFETAVNSAQAAMRKQLWFIKIITDYLKTFIFWLV